MTNTENTTPDLLNLDAVPAGKSDQLLGWLYMKLAGGTVIDAGEWNKAVQAMAGTK